MKTTVTKRYLCLPVTREAQKKTVIFYKDGAPVFDFVSRLDVVRPEMYMYLDLRDYLGQSFEIKTKPAMNFKPHYVARPPKDGIFAEKYRPAIHFSAELGYINDPNGLVFYENKWHMFFQHNPCDTNWGNCHWGHAESSDLLHWKQKPAALMPDDMGLMFSGSAFTDTENVTGLKNGEHDVLLLFYTAAGGNTVTSKNRPFVQCMAYSTDGAKTFIKYEKNPIVDHIYGSNRDPKVVYSPEEQLYYMALYLGDNRYELLTSKNLLDWRRRSEVNLSNDAECPDLFFIRHEGSVYWVFIGASDRYLIGSVRDGVFKPCQPLRRLSYGKPRSSYAGQTFAGCDRPIRIAWNTAPLPRMPFSGSMTTPVQLSLEKDGDELCLCALPVPELSRLAGHIKKIPGALLLEEGTPAKLALEGVAQDISLELIMSSDSLVNMNILGAAYEICAEENALKFGGNSMPLFCENGRVVLRIVTDVHCTEIYAADGKAFTAAAHIADYNLPRISLCIKSGKVIVNRLQSAELSPVFTEPAQNV